MSLRLVGSFEARQVARLNVSGQGGDYAGEANGALRLGMLRLAATRLCPIPREVLVAATLTALRGLESSEASSPSDVDGDLDALVASGDVLLGSELVGEKPRAMIYLAPPMFVRRSSGAVYVMGGLAEGSSPFKDITRLRGPLRELLPAPSDQELVDEGFTAFPMDAWMESPSARSEASLLQELEDGLDRTGNSGELLELELLDPEANPAFYRGRWVPARRASGRFIARRKRKWGGRAWGYAEVVDGQAVKFRTFPVIDPRFRACDEAWWAIFAMDASRGSRQPAEIDQLGDITRLAVRTPLPMWVERRLLAVGALAETRPSGALVAYDLRAVDAEEEIKFLVDHLWMEPVYTNRGTS